MNSVHSVEVYLPWNNTWLELPPLPLIDCDQRLRMDNTRIFSLDKDGWLTLYLLGGFSSLDNGMGYNTRAVWRLDWITSNQSYRWTKDDDLYPPMGELHH